MASTPRLTVSPAHKQLISLITSLAFALTFFRFSAARIQAQRAAASADPE